MFAIAIDAAHQLHKGHAALAGNLLQIVPELVFKADARLVACDDNRALLRVTEVKAKAQCILAWRPG